MEGDECARLFGVFELKGGREDRGDIVDVEGGLIRGGVTVPAAWGGEYGIKRSETIVTRLN
jgi:hypothetical protein